MRVYTTSQVMDFLNNEDLGTYLDKRVDVRRGFAKILDANIEENEGEKYLRLSLEYRVNGEDIVEDFDIVGKDSEGNFYYEEFLEKFGRKDKGLLKGPKTLRDEEVFYFINCEWRGLSIREEFNELLYEELPYEEQES